MTIKSKLVLNASIVILAVAAVSISSFIGMNSIQGKLSYLTEKSTPYQVRTVEFQRALQGAAADLIKVVAARNEQEFTAAKGEAEKSLAEVQQSQDRLEAVSGEKLEASAAFATLAGELFTTMTARLKSEKESSEAHALIVQNGKEVDTRIHDLEKKVKSLQQSSSAAYSKANEEADKISKNLASIETLKVSLKEARYHLFDLQRLQEKKQAQNLLAASIRKIQQNSNIRHNKQIGAKFAAFSAKAEQLVKTPAEGGDARRGEAILKEALADLQEVEDLIEDEVDKSQLLVGSISVKLPGHMTRANAAVGVLSNNTELVSLADSLEALAGRLFFAGSQKELDGIASEFNQQYLRLATVERSVASLLRTAGAGRELRILQEVVASLSGIREKVFAQQGVLEKLRQKIQLQAQAENCAAKLREVVAQQAEKGKQTVSVAQEGQEIAIGTVNRTIRFSMTLILIIAVVSAIFGTLVGTWIYRSISGPIGQLITTAERVAGGDLTVSIAASSKDEVGRVQGSMAKMLESIREVVGRIGLATDTLASSSEEMAATAGVLETGAARQAGRVDDSASTMAEMTCTTLDMAQNTAEAANTADMMKETAQEGKKAMQLTVQELQKFAETFTETAVMVEQLGEQSAQISDIGTLIRDIADQTNLLALNAAIEAARAGDQGRGFAVVADSVRELAERTSTATADINHTVKNMQVSVNRSVVQMGHEKEAMNTILTRVNGTVEAIDRIAKYVDQVNDMVRRIAIATEEQSAASSEVSHNVEEISLLTRELRTACSGIRESSDGLSRLASDLNGMVGWFKV